METNDIINDKWKSPNLPFDQLLIWDIIVVKYEEWSIQKKFPWENWHHAWLISEIDWEYIKFIEAPWYTNWEDKPPIWPIESLFEENKLYIWDDVKEILLLKPKFPKTIRKKWSWIIPRLLQRILSEDEAREEVVEYARNQIWKEYNELSSKWDNDEYYCSKLVFKSYSMTIIWMHLEVYHSPFFSVFWKLSSWPTVTPEDLVESKKTEIYYHFIKE